MSAHLISKFEGLTDAGDEVAGAAATAVEDVAAPNPTTANSFTVSDPFFSAFCRILHLRNVAHKIHHIRLTRGGEGDSTKAVVEEHLHN